MPSQAGKSLVRIVCKPTRANTLKRSSHAHCTFSNWPFVWRLEPARSLLNRTEPWSVPLSFTEILPRPLNTNSRKWWSTQAVYGSGKFLTDSQLQFFRLENSLPAWSWEAWGWTWIPKTTKGIIDGCCRCCPNNGCQRIPLQARVPLCAHRARAFPVWAVPVLGLFQMEEEWAGLQTGKDVSKMFDLLCQRVIHCKCETRLLLESRLRFPRWLRKVSSTAPCPPSGPASPFFYCLW